MMWLNDWYGFKITHRIEGGIAKETADLSIRSLHLEAGKEATKRLADPLPVGYRQAFPAMVRKGHHALVRVDAKLGDGRQGDVGEAVLVAMEVGALQQDRTGINITEFQVEADRCLQVAHDGLALGMELVSSCHDLKRCIVLHI